MAKTRSEINYNYAKKAYDRINVQLPKGYKETIQQHTETTGESMQGFVRRAIDETIERDKEK